MSELDVKVYDATASVECDVQEYDASNSTELDINLYDATTSTESDVQVYDVTTSAESNVQVYDTTNTAELDINLYDATASAESDVQVYGTANSTELDIKLYDAADSGDATQVQDILDKNTANVNFKFGRRGSFPLYQATLGGHTDVVSLLIQHNADVNITDDIREQTSLHAAVEGGQTEVVKVLVQSQRCDVNIKDSLGSTPLRVAAKQGLTEEVKVLLQDQKCDVNIRDKRGRTAFHTAVEHGHIMVATLIKESPGFDLGQIREIDEIKMHDLERKLYDAAESSDLTRISDILENNDVDVNCKPGRWGESPLYISAKRGHLEAVSLLMTYNANVNITENLRGVTPLYIAAVWGHLDVVSLLMNFGADVNVTDTEGFTALFEAVKRGHFEVARKLLQSQRCNINIRNLDGSTVLDYAAEDGLKEIVVLLLQHGALINMFANKEAVEEYTISTEAFHLLSVIASIEPEVEKQFSTDPIFEATGYHVDEICVLNAYSEILSTLLSRNIFKSKKRVNFLMKNGHTRLTYAASIGNVFMIDSLIKHEADLTRRNIHGQHPLNVAIQHDYKSAVSTILRSFRSKQESILRQEDSNCMSPASVAALEGNIEILNLLVEYNHECLTWSDTQTRSPIFYATMEGHLEVMKHILQKDQEMEGRLSLTAADEYGNTLLTLALKYNHPEVMRYLISQCGKYILFDGISNLFKLQHDGFEVDDESRHWKELTIVEAALELKWLGFGYILFSGEMGPDEFLKKIYDHGLEDTYGKFLRYAGMQAILRAVEEKEDYISFLKSHLPFLAKCKNNENLRELTTYLIESAKSQEANNDESTMHDIYQMDKHGKEHLFATEESAEDEKKSNIFSPRKFLISKNDLLDILHHKDSDQQTVLYYVNLNHDIPGAMELICAIKEANHESVKTGLQSIARAAGYFPLRSWMLETYKNYHQEENLGRMIGALILVLMVVLPSYIFLIYDFVSDIALCVEYGKILSYGSKTTNWNCTTLMHTSYWNASIETQGIEGCLKISDVLVSIYITAFVISLSALAYTWVSFKYEMSYCKDRTLIQIILRIFWPVVLMYRKFRYEVSDEKETLAKEISVDNHHWEFIKTLENCVENSLQFFLQVLILCPFLVYLESPELILNAGLEGMNIFGNSCFVEKLFGKILISILSLSYGVANLKTQKPGMNAADQLIKNIVLWISILLQTVGRSLAILLLFSTDNYYLTTSTFLSLHFLLVAIIFIIQIQINNSWEIVMKTNNTQRFKFIMSIFSSITILTNLHEKNDERSDGRSNTTFYSNFLFQLIILLENMFLTATSSSNWKFLPDSAIMCGIMFGLWFGGVFIQAIYYRFLHELGIVNGPEIEKIIKKFNQQKCSMNVENLIDPLISIRDCCTGHNKDSESNHEQCIHRMKRNDTVSRKVCIYNDGGDINRSFKNRYQDDNGCSYKNKDQDKDPDEHNSLLNCEIVRYIDENGWKYYEEDQDKSHDEHTSLYSDEVIRYVDESSDTEMN